MKVKKIITFSLVFSSIIPLYSCGDTSNSSSSSSKSINTVSQKVKVTLFDKTNVEEATIELYKDELFIASGVTNENGETIIQVPNYDKYEIKLTNAKPGFKLDADYYTSISGNDIIVDCTTSVIESEIPNDVDFNYEIGNVIYDLAYTECNETEETKFSSILKEKDLIILNFFFTTCPPCLKEFPHMEDGYQLYKDKIEIIALSDTDTKEQIKTFKEHELLSFDLATDDYFITFFFQVFNFPTTIIIDKYGVIGYRTSDYIKSVDEFCSLVDPFLANDYVPTITDYNYL